MNSPRTARALLLVLAATLGGEACVSPTAAEAQAGDSADTFELLLEAGAALEPPSLTAGIGVEARWWLADALGAIAWVRHQRGSCDEIAAPHPADLLLARLGVAHVATADVDDAWVVPRAVLSGGLALGLGMPVHEGRASCEPSRRQTFPTHGEVGLFGRVAGELWFGDVFLLGVGILTEARVALGDVHQRLHWALIGGNVHLGVTF